LVADRCSKEPFHPARKLHAYIKQAAIAHGLMVYPMGGPIDGRRGDHVRIAPPLIVTGQDIDTIFECLGDSVDTALTGLA
jgi:adenosylmethionine-8-amino-7-oxononanoate aminotransferase